jgi:hypothetical protein
VAARPEPSPVQAVKLISRNAVIVAAVRGYGYCRSAARAAQLLLGNAVTLATVTSTAYVLLLVGRLAVAAATTAVVWATLASNPLASPDVELLRIKERCAFCIPHSLAAADVCARVRRRACSAGAAGRSLRCFRARVGGRVPAVTLALTALAAWLVGRLVVNTHWIVIESMLMCFLDDSESANVRAPPEASAVFKYSRIPPEA